MTSVDETSILVVQFVLGCAGAPLAIWSVHQRSGSLDRMFGDLSFPLYMFHWIPRDWYYHEVDWSRHWSHNAMLLLINFIVAYLGAIILLFAIDRPSEKLRRNWLSKRPCRQLEQPQH